MRIAILVTHLLGTGHLKRASLIADGFVKAGHEALVLSGGLPAPNAAPKTAELLQIPPLRADGPAFTGLVDSEGNPADTELLSSRQNAISRALAALRPHMFITELFPFGRRKLSAEFLSAIANAGDALIFSSIRDILQRPRKPERVIEANDRFATHYDGAFFHGSDQVVPLEKSWPIREDLKSRVLSTGYIGEAATPYDPEGDGAGEIIVAAGGGSVGTRLFEASVDTVKLREEGRTWRLLVGGHDKSDRIAALLARAPKQSNLIVEPIRPDFRELLARCDLAIMQCGYNSAMDIVATGAQALFCPFENGETEQRQRAVAMSEQFGCGVISEDELSGERLSRAVDQALATPPPDYSAVKLNGIERTVELATKMMSDRFGVGT